MKSQEKDLYSDNGEIFTAIHNEWYAQMYAFAKRILKQKGIRDYSDLARDVVQESFINLYKNMDTLRLEDVNKYLPSIVHNKAIDYLRKMKPERLVMMEDVPEKDSSTDSFFQDPDQFLIQDDVKKLADLLVKKSKFNETQKTVLYFYKDSDYGDGWATRAAEELGMPEATVRWHKSKIVDKLKKVGTNYFITNNSNLNDFLN